MADQPDDQLLVLSEVLAALGDNGVMKRYNDEIDLAAIVGSAVANRAEDFDRAFQPRNRALANRQKRAATNRDHQTVNPVDLIRLGELYFVRDGHHRIAAAASAGIDTIPASITRYCTVAFAMCCLSTSDLTVKAAERRFLQRIPLPDAITRTLWLDRPATWARLADSAQAWTYQHPGFTAGQADPHTLAAAWWDTEVRPIVETLRNRGHGLDLNDLQLYVTALAARDNLGILDWPEGIDHSRRYDALCQKADENLL